MFKRFICFFLLVIIMSSQRRGELFRQYYAKRMDEEEGEEIELKEGDEGQNPYYGVAIILLMLDWLTVY